MQKRHKKECLEFRMTLNPRPVEEMIEMKGRKKVVPDVVEIEIESYGGECGCP